ncbi:MAG: hypothetical protein ACQGVC_23490 [Myxococcota bacterium]
MSDEEEPQGIGEIRVDTANLYREEVYTDLRVATIRKLVPVRADGSDDPGRPALFSGQTNLMSQAGPLPVECPIEAASLEEATAKFPEAIQQAVDRLVEEAKEMRRREASRIVVPGGPLPGGGMPGGGGGMPGGGGGGGILGGGNL